MDSLWTREQVKTARVAKAQGGRTDNRKLRCRDKLAWLTESISPFLVSNSRVERSKSTTHPVGLRLAILFMALSAAVGFFVSVASLREPFPVTGHLMGATDFAAPNGLLKYALGLVSIFLCTVPLLYSGIAMTFNFTNAATSITLAFASVLFGIAEWGLYRFKNWARLLTVAIFHLHLPANAWELPAVFRRQLHRHDGILAVCCPLWADGLLFQARRCSATFCASPDMS